MITILPISTIKSERFGPVRIISVQVEEQAHAWKPEDHVGRLGRTGIAKHMGAATGGDDVKKRTPPPHRTAKSTNRSNAKAIAAKAPKLTPDQILANQTLASAESQARGLEAPMRSYSLLQIAEAFTVSDPAKARGLLQDAFSASLSVQDDPFARENLQQDIFHALLPISMSDVEERLAQAEPRPRKQAADGIISRYIEKKQFSKAVDLVEQVASLDEFPYAAGGRLLEALPAEMNAEKQTLFASAAASYRAHEHKGAFGTMGDNSFTGLLIRFGDTIPPKLALEAIDEILSQARKNDDKFSVTVGGTGGSASFNSNYEYQLFAVLPLLRKLDESGADNLLKENAALKSTMQQYPNGMDSVSPRPAAAPDKDAAPPRRGTSFNVSDNSSKASSEEAMRQEMHAALRPDPQRGGDRSYTGHRPGFGPSAQDCCVDALAPCQRTGIYRPHEHEEAAGVRAPGRGGIAEDCHRPSHA